MNGGLTSGRLTRSPLDNLPHYNFFDIRRWDTSALDRFFDSLCPKLWGCEGSEAAVKYSNGAAAGRDDIGSVLV
jgi:hypothetical protein